MSEKRPLTRREVVDVIDGKANAPRVPLMFPFWVNPEIFADPKAVQAVLRQCPNDIQCLPIRIPEVFSAPPDAPSYRWAWRDASSASAAMDNAGFIEDWDTELEPLLADFPSADYAGLTAHNAPDDGRYRLGGWWYFFFERFWSIRGMENALTDFILYPNEVHRLFRRLTDFYLRMLERCKAEMHLDGVFTSDDLGTQTSLFFSTDIFDEFFAPYYREVIQKAHALDMHFWLHTCGNIEKLLPRFIELGVDVIHPIQKYTMDEARIAKAYGDQITILAGFDVQRTIPYGTEDDVRRETRFLIDTYLRKNGRFMLTLGNNATADTPLTSLSALLQEALCYGESAVSAIK